MTASKIYGLLEQPRLTKQLRFPPSADANADALCAIEYCMVSIGSLQARAMLLGEFRNAEYLAVVDPVDQVIGRMQEGSRP